MSENIEHQESREQWRYPYDAVIVLGGGLRKLDSGKYVPTDYRQSDPFGMLGAGMRLVAATELYLQRQAKGICFYHRHH